MNDINQPINQSVCRSVDWSVGRSVGPSVRRSVGRSVGQSINQCGSLFCMCNIKAVVRTTQAHAVSFRRRDFRNRIRVKLTLLMFLITNFLNCIRTERLFDWLMSHRYKYLLCVVYTANEQVCVRFSPAGLTGSSSHPKAKQVLIHRFLHLVEQLPCSSHFLQVALHLIPTMNRKEKKWSISCALGHSYKE